MAVHCHQRISYAYIESFLLTSNMKIIIRRRRLKTLMEWEKTACVLNVKQLCNFRLVENEIKKKKIYIYVFVAEHAMVLVPVHRVCGFPLFFSTAISSGIFTRNFTSACSLTPFSIKIHVNDSVPRCEHEMIPLTPVYVLSVVITLCIHYG